MIAGKARYVMTESAAEKAELARLRKELMDKKTQITLLEQKALKYEEIGRLLTHVVQDFQKTGKIFFVETSKIGRPFQTPEEGVDIVRAGINSLIAKHERLASRFELEFSRSVFQMRQKIGAVEDELEKEQRLASEAESKTHHADRLVRMLEYEKRSLIGTIRMRRAALARHNDAREAAQVKAAEQLELATNEHRSLQELEQQHEIHTQQVTQRQTARLSQEQHLKAEHQWLLAETERLKEQLNQESFRHNCALAERDKAKAELAKVVRAIDSYHGSLKAQELLEAEAENQKLHAVKNTEQEMYEKKLAIAERKGKEAENDIRETMKRIENLNHQIAQTEQKLQTQMTRIPDFPQLREILKRTMEQCQAYREEVTERRYLLDEVRASNIEIDGLYMQDSINRMEELKRMMPLEEEREKQIPVPQIVVDGKKQLQDMEQFVAENYPADFQNLFTKKRRH